MNLEDFAYKPSETLIYLTQGGDGFRGFAEHSATGQVFRFDNIPEMFRVHEQLFNSLHYPESAGVPRGGQSGGRGDALEPVYTKKDVSLPGEPVFALRVLYRQYASWQGTLRWIPGRTTSTFRSTLELLLLFDRFLNEGDDRKTG